ncbi:hypothetical protein NAA27_14510 [Listeria monocytogenes]|nr:hypothetical protein [Listeria monocytogenes]
MTEQAYKTQTAENDYLRSGVELDHAYRQNDFQDNLLVQAGNDTTSPELVSFDTASTEPVIESINDSAESKESSSPNEKEEISSYSESDIEPVSVEPKVEQETVLPVEEMDAGLLYQRPSSEETEQHQIDQTEENRDNQIEAPRFTSESQHQPVPVEPEEAKQLAKEMGELRQETYEEVEISEEPVYEVI